MIRCHKESAHRYKSVILKYAQVTQCYHSSENKLQKRLFYSIT